MSARNKPGRVVMSRVAMPFKSAHKTPAIELAPNKKWVNFGLDTDWFNNFPGYLIELFNRSPKHNAIITGKLLYLMGQGWRAVGTMQSFLDKANSDETLAQLTEKILMDYELFDGFYAEPIFNKLGNKIIEWRHIPFDKVRVNLTASQFWLSERWTTATNASDKNTIEFEAFKFEKTIYQKGKRYLYQYKSYRPGNKSYPMPNYLGGLAAIETDVEISNFNLNAIKNNLSVGKLVAVYNGIPTDEERKAFESGFHQNKTGTDNAGETIFAYSDSKERNVDVLDLSGTELDKRYNLLNESIMQEILTTHKVVSGMLFGVKTPGQLGGRDEILQAAELFKAIYIEPRKRPVVKIFNQMATAMGLSGSLELIETEAVAQPIQPAPGQPIASPATVAQRQQFSHDPKKLISIFSKYGMSRDDVEVLETIHDWRDKIDSVNQKSLSLLEKVTLMEFAVKISELEASILDYLKKDSLTETASIAAALKVNIDDVVKGIESLKEKGFLKSTANGTVVTATGEKALTKNLPETSQTFIVYHYDVAPGLGDIIIPTSREFCRDMVGMNKVFSRKDIEDVSQEYGYSVWELRGGYYHNPSTDQTTEYCRHIFSMEVVTKKTK